ncbi:MAG TPA: hypothetical protein VM121_09090, partial [Acidimicrobiales bacterium]|nr:hypothetical protein [Acidimicrobiales bacterium]
MKMNHYATLAYDHARQHRPKAFAAMADPIAHFSRLGEEVENRIMTMRDQLLATPSSPETFEDYRRRAYQARRQAEEMVLAEMVWT